MQKVRQIITGVPKHILTAVLVANGHFACLQIPQLRVCEVILAAASKLSSLCVFDFEKVKANS